MRVKMSKQPPPAPTASAVGPCPTLIQTVGRPGTGSLPSTIAPPDHPHNSGIRVAVGDCSVTERRRWRPPYQTGKAVYVHVKHYKHNEDGLTAPGVCGNGSVPLSHSGSVVTRIGIRTRNAYDILRSFADF